MTENMVCKQGENKLRKLLAAAVRSIQWSYAIYWTTSSKEHGVLQWGEGYYNGDIKTRRTVLSMDLQGDDQIGYERCDKLRELYESLLSSNNNNDNNSNNQARRPLAALSPEDLTNVEWFYLVCMSFVFKIGQGLPGTCFADGRTMWLCNSHSADTNIFWRSLLAKSAGIKTVVCFPFENGVIELGVTEEVQEDLDLIKHVKASFLENSSSFLPWKTNTTLAQFRVEDNFNPELLPSLVVQGDQEVSSSDEAELFLTPDEAILLKDLNNGDVSQAQTWFGLTNCLHTSMSTSDCISQSILHPEHVPSSPKVEVMTDDASLQKIDSQEWHLEKAINVLHSTSMSQDLHFQNVLSSLFKTSNHEMLGQSSETMDKKSSFIRWEKGCQEIVKFGYEGTTTPQKMLKKILFEVPLLHRAHSIEPKDDNELRKQEVDVSSTNHVLAERRRREKVNERFSTLRSLLPSISKVDKVSILDDTIAYLKELERRVEELESSHELASYDAMMKKKRKAIDIEERTSDNYGNEINVGDCDKITSYGIDEGVQVVAHVSPTRQNLIIDNNTLLVRLVEKEILIDIRCPWRDGLLFEIIDKISSLQLESQSVQSSTVDGILSLTMHTTLEGSANASVGAITQALQRVIRSC